MTTNRLKGKVALVTGGGRGIGRAVAERLAAEGAAVAICSRTERELRKTVREITKQNGEACYWVADLASPRSIQSLVQKLLRRYPQIDILINNASLLGPRVPIAEYPLKEWEAVLNVNLTGLFLVTREILRTMIPKKSGCILNITSSVGRKGRARWGAYAVSKFGVEGLNQILADELREDRIRVMALNPGGTRTVMRAEAYPDEDPKLLQSPDAVAEAVLHLVLQEEMAMSGKSFDAKDILQKIQTSG